MFHKRMRLRPCEISTPHQQKESKCRLDSVCRTLEIFTGEEEKSRRFPLRKNETFPVLEKSFPFTLELQRY